MEKIKITDKIEKIIEETKAKLLSSETVYQDHFITLKKEYYELPNQKKITRDRIIKNNGKEAVLIVAKTVDDKYVIVIQNRINEITSVEFPAGYIEINEDAQMAAKRELLEETGYDSNDICYLDNYQAQLGIDSSMVHIVLALNCKKVKNQELGESEYINYLEVTEEELKELVSLGYIKGCGNKLAFYLLEDYQNKELKK